MSSYMHGGIDSDNTVFNREAFDKYVLKRKLTGDIPDFVNDLNLIVILNQKHPNVVVRNSNSFAQMRIVTCGNKRHVRLDLSNIKVYTGIQKRMQFERFVKSGCLMSKPFDILNLNLDGLYSRMIRIDNDSAFFSVDSVFYHYEEYKSGKTMEFSYTFVYDNKKHYTDIRLGFSKRGIEYIRIIKPEIFEFKGV